MRLGIWSSVYVSLWAGLTLAQTSQFAHCDDLAREYNLAANGGLAKEQRLQELDRIASDLKLLIQESQLAKTGKSPYPLSMLETCRKKKGEILSTHAKTSDAATRDSPAFYRVMGTVAWLNAKTSEQFKIRDLSDAYESFNTAVQRNEKDWSSKQDRFSVYLALSSARMGSANYSASDLTQYMKTMESLLNDLVVDKYAPVETKVAVLKSYARWIASVQPHRSEAVKQWKRVLDLTPSDEEALIEIGSYHYQARSYKDAVTAWSRLHAIRKDLAEYTEPFVDSLFQIQDYNGVIAAAKEAKLPRSALLASRSARAYFELGKFEEAQRTNTLALKLGPTDAVTKVTESLLLEREADGAAERKMLSSALQQYEAAYRLDPSRPILRRKMAIMVYGNRKQAKFEPVDTAKAEMKFVTELLTPVMVRPEIGTDGMEILIFATEFTQQDKATVVACERYEADFGPFGNSKTLETCANAYTKGGKRQQAVKLLKFGIGSQKFEESRGQMRELLQRIE